MDIEQIRGETSLRSWLEGHDQTFGVVVANRAAFRVFPLFSEATNRVRKRNVDLSALPVLRALLTSNVFERTHESDFRLAAFEAATGANERALYSAARSSKTSADPLRARNAASAAGYAAGASAELVLERTASHAARAVFVADYWPSSRLKSAVILDRAHEDLRSLLRAENLFVKPLWRLPAPNWFVSADRKTRALWAFDPPGVWDFWLRWWDGILSGNQVSRDLQRDIVLELKEKDWSAGPAHVAERIAEIEARYKSPLEVEPSPLASAAVFDFDFDTALRRLEIIGFTDDMAHLKDPATVSAFLDDIEEVRDGLQDFQDYAEAARNGNNSTAVLGLASEKILEELKRTKDKAHVRARRIIGLSGDLFTFSTEETKRNELGPGLCKKLDANVALLRAACRKHLAVAIMRLEPLDRLQLGDADPAVMLADLRKAMDAVRAKADGQELARLSPEAQAVLNDMLGDLETLERALAVAGTEAQKANIQERFVKGYGALAATTGRAVEKAQQHADKPVKWFDGMTRWYKRWETLQNILDWLSTLGGGGTPPPGV